MKRIVLAACATWWFIAALDHEGTVFVWIPMASRQECIIPPPARERFGYPPPLCISLPLRGLR